jgi:flavin-dependent dehydrogenase
MLACWLASLLACKPQCLSEKNMSNVDVIVVGAGPAGLMAAKTAAEEGLKVALLDTKEHISRYTRPCCSMWILEPGFHHEGWSFAGDRIYFLRNDFSITYQGTFTDLYRSVRISPAGHTLIMGKRNQPIAKVIDKQKLLEGLLHEVDQLGVDIRPRTTALEAREEGDQVQVKIRHHHSQEWLSGTWLLAADGVNSRITESLGFNKNRKVLIRTQVIHYVYANVKSPYPDAWIQCMGYGFNGVCGAMIRKPDYDDFTQIYEVFARPPMETTMPLGESIRRLISAPQVKDWFKDAKLIRTMGCLWTCWEPIKEPARGRTILVGDAPSFQEAEIQGALMCGFRAGKAIKMEAQDEPGIEHYNRFWQDHFEFNDDHIFAECCRTFGLGSLKNDQLDYLYTLAQGKLLDGYINHFTCGKVMLDFFSSHRERIKRERPDILETLTLLKKVSPEEAFKDPGREGGEL